MNLLQLRTNFVQKSGRFDLVVDTTSYADNGANFFIQMGQRILEAMFPSRHSASRYIKDLNAGQSSLFVKNIRAIDSVYLKNSSIGRKPLTRKGYSWLIEEYGDDFGEYAQGTLTLTAAATSGIVTIDSETYTFGTVDAIVAAINAGSSIASAQKLTATTILITYYLVGTAGNSIVFTTTYDTGTVDGGGVLGGTIAGRTNGISTGTPLYYAPVIHTPNPAMTVSSMGSLDTYDILFGVDKHSKDGILFMPPADVVYTMTVNAHFFAKLTSDLDTSYYSERYPEMSLIAANLALEAFYRNSQGLNDWLNMLKIEMTGIDHDLVHEEMALSGNIIRG